MNANVGRDLCWDEDLLSKTGEFSYMKQSSEWKRKMKKKVAWKNIFYLTFSRENSQLTNPSLDCVETLKKFHE